MDGFPVLYGEYITQVGRFVPTFHWVCLKKMNKKKQGLIIIIPFQQLAMFSGGKRLYKSPCSVGKMRV